MDGSTTLKRTQLTIGLLLVALGVIFLVGQGLDFRFVEDWWPAFIVVPGLAMLAVALTSGEGGAPVAIPGSIVTTVGLLLAFQNLTGAWQTWAYLWPLVAPGAVGAGLWLFGARSDREQLKGVGWRLALAGLVLAVVLGLFFELLLGLSGPVGPLVARILWPLALIAAGLWLILPKRRRG